MGKYAILAGMLVAAIMLVKINDGKISVLEAVDYLDVEKNELQNELKIEGHLKSPGLKKNFYQNIYDN
ncbi:hypothetical protein HY605_02385, partial [Candidatus Peregrinibacteria bacterium]|nr:hypothetical protein [Candidatus Peregrinibacteria bacterium]